jgi:hypothetical protein
MRKGFNIANPGGAGHWQPEKMRGTIARPAGPPIGDYFNYLLMESFFIEPPFAILTLMTWMEFLSA